MKKLLKLNNVIDQELTKAEIYNVKGGIGPTNDCPTGCDINAGYPIVDGSTAAALAQDLPSGRL
ncbi:MAG: hypothetical protein GQ534_07420 [Candidatus Delongbacteria bacterium]|nr:hypothetical protein [Candidatus Delongbacteria bacterium]